MTRKYVVRGEPPRGDPPTEFWLQTDDDGDVRMYAAQGSGTAYLVMLVSAGTFYPGQPGSDALQRLGLNSAEGKVVIG